MPTGHECSRFLLPHLRFSYIYRGTGCFALTFVELDFFDNANETRLGTGGSFTYGC